MMCSRNSFVVSISKMGALLLLVLCLWSSTIILACRLDEACYNVMEYGAINDGRTDSSHAFLTAWDIACKTSAKSPTLYVPPNTSFLVNPIIFKGPCNASTINFLNLGRMTAPKSVSAWDGKSAGDWVVFTNIAGLHVDGNGVIDGSGKPWWDQSCRYHPQLKKCTTQAPTMLQFRTCKGSSVRNMKMINSAQTHILVSGCNDFNVDNVTIESPGDSPNTDGIHISLSHHLHITNSTIASGDDCISIGNYNSDLHISNIHCGPGHGISIGSLGTRGSFAQVENIDVSDVTFTGTTNGARIKTWQEGRGYLKGVTFERLTFNNVQNPIIIDQHYCNIANACAEKKSGVAISNVKYRNLVGTSASEIAINLNCSRSVPCSGISMESVELTSAIAGKQVTANCNNAYGEELRVKPGPSCLQHQALI